MRSVLRDVPVIHPLWRRFLLWHRSRLRPDQYPKALKRLYADGTGETLDLENPKTFGEKIQWLKLYDNPPIKTVLADKYRVRQWVSEKIGDDHLIPLLGTWENADDIDFNALPDQFALKANHGSGTNIIVKDKRELDIKKTKKTLNKWLKSDYSLMGFELHYKHIPPMVIAEKYIENIDGDVYDYKFYCFHGEPRYCLIIIGRHAEQRRAVVDMNFEITSLTIGTQRVGAFPEVDLSSAKPENYGRMVTLARTLCEGLKFVRVDFYNVRGKIYFGEMTFHPMGGMGKILPREYETVLGDLILLS